MKLSKLIFVCSLFVIIGFSGCDIINPGRVNDPNDPAVGEVLQNANKTQLQNLLSGLEARNRNSTVGFASFGGTLGREIYPMFAAEARNLNITYGLSPGASAENDPSFYGIGNSWSEPYSVIKQANVLLTSLKNTDEVSTQEKNGYRGVTKTIKAFQYLIPLLTQKHSNGIRIKVSDPLHPGPFVPFKKALKQIRSLLNEAQNNLEKSGNNFAFELSSGLSEFNTPATFKDLNQAIAARAAIYDKDWEGALQAVNDARPFFNLDQGKAVMNKGAYFVYNGPPDLFNPYYNPHNVETSGINMVANSMIKDAEQGDKRVINKFFKRNDPIIQQGIIGRYQDDRFKSNTSPFPWFRNEELILIYAEANIQLNNLQKAKKAINFIRKTWGLSEFNGKNKKEFIDQLLHERQYSLWEEFGHRWIDAKRYNRLDQLPKNKGQIFRYISRPQSEISWEGLH